MSNKPVKRPSNRHRARELAVQALYESELSANSKAEVLENTLAREEAKHFDITYFHELFNQVIDNQATIDEQLTPYLDRPLAELGPVELSILRLASYELTAHLEIPYKVILNEAIELSKTFGANEAHKYINGVLDQVAQAVRSAEK